MFLSAIFVESYQYGNALIFHEGIVAVTRRVELVMEFMYGEIEPGCIIYPETSLHR